MLKTGFILITVAGIFFGGGICRADSQVDIVKENAELKKRVDRLEKELQELKKIVMSQAQAAKAEPRARIKRPAEAKPVTSPELSKADVDKLMAMLDKTNERNPIWSSLDIQFYGYIKADASYDSSRVTTGNFVKWVDRENRGNDDDEFNMTANQTRFGLLISGPQDDGLKTSGRVEADFYGGGAENKAHIRMRHAYLKLDWPDERFNIIAGQTSDLISPLYPNTLNFTVLWDSGNIGHRHPQLRLTKEYALKDDVDLQLAGAISRTIGDNSVLEESGEDSGAPTLQGRVGLTFPWLGYKPTTVGISGHWGEEEYGSKDVDSWSFNFDMTQPINEWLTIKGEYFSGENLDNYFGGIEQGVNATTIKEIASKGGWMAASLGPWDKYRFNLGIGIDDVEDSDVSAGGRTLNRSIFGNVIYSINKNTDIGFELSHWRTRYKGDGDADDLRVQTSFIYKF